MVRLAASQARHRADEGRQMPCNVATVAARFRSRTACLLGGCYREMRIGLSARTAADHEVILKSNR